PSDGDFAPRGLNSAGRPGPAEGALDGREDDRRPIESAWYLAGESDFRRHRERWPDHAALEHGRGSEGKRTHTKKPAATRSMSPRRFSGIVVAILGTAAMHVVMYGIGISEAVDGVAAVAEGHDRRRCDKA